MVYIFDLDFSFMDIMDLYLLKTVRDYYYFLQI